MRHFLLKCLVMLVRINNVCFQLRLEAVVLDLETEREDMITQMKQEEFEMAK